MQKMWAEECLSKVIQPEDLEDKVSFLRKQGKTIATLNGSFDLMHAGHLQIIYEASLQANCLIVALNSDKSIQAYKSLSRPIIPLKYRIQLMAALEFIDYVTWFDETDPRALLSIIKPDIHINGLEYGENCIEAETVKANGGKIHLVPKVDGISTTQIISKIRTV